MPAIRVFLVDDHELVRNGLRSLIEPIDDIVCVGEAATAGETMARVRVAEPDVVVLDVRLPDGSGIELCREIRSQFPSIACLMLTSYADDDALAAAVMAGAAGYVLKEVKGIDLVDSIRSVYRHGSLVNPDLARQVIERVRKIPEEDTRLVGLTAQERHILDLIAEGKTNRQIGEEMYLAEKTVKNYVSNLLSKLGMRRRTEAAVYAARLAERKHLEGQ